MKIFNGLDSDIVINVISREKARDNYQDSSNYNRNSKSVMLSSNESTYINTLGDVLIYMSSKNPTRLFTIGTDFMSRSQTPLSDDSRIAIGAKVYEVTNFVNEKSLKTFDPNYIYSVSYAAPVSIYLAYAFIVIVITILLSILFIGGVGTGWYFFKDVILGKIGIKDLSFE